MVAGGADTPCPRDDAEVFRTGGTRHLVADAFTLLDDTAPDDNPPDKPSPRYTQTVWFRTAGAGFIMGLGDGVKPPPEVTSVTWCGAKDYSSGKGLVVYVRTDGLLDFAT